MTSFAVCMLLIPLLLMFAVKMRREEIAGLIFIFVLIFSITISVIMDSKVQDIFVMTAL